MLAASRCLVCGRDAALHERYCEGGCRGAVQTAWDKLDALDIGGDL